MKTAERIITGLASLIALVGWLRWVGDANSHGGEPLKQNRLAHQSINVRRTDNPNGADICNG